MQEAVPVGVGAMAAILGLELSRVAEVAVAAAEDETCEIANINSPVQIVIAGHRTAVERAVQLATEAGARRAVILPVSAPFHSPLMKSAREQLAPLLEATEFSSPKVPLVCNVDAVALTSGKAARDALIRQVDQPVRWVESVEHMAAKGVRQAVEVGPGSVLCGLVKRIDRSVSTATFSTPEGWQSWVDSQGGDG